MVKNKLKSMLIIYNEIPLPTIHGGNIRTWHLIKELSRYYNLTLLTLKNKRNYEIPKELLDYCNVIIAPSFIEDFFRESILRFPKYLINTFYLKMIRSLPFGNQLLKKHNYSIFCLKKALKKLLMDKKFDFIQVEHFYLSPILDGIKTKSIKILDFHNVHSFMKYSRNQRKLIKQYETKTSEIYDITLFCSRLDKQRMQKNGFKHVKIVPNGVDTKYFKPSKTKKEPSTLLFVGNLNYQPNFKAVEFFLGKIYPLLKSNLKINIVGNPAKRRINNKKVCFHGFVKDIRPFFSKSIFICPILQGGGTRIKILTAFASGCPVISTTKGAEGIECTNNKDIIIADSTRDFADKINKLVNNSKLYNKVRTNARNLVKSKYDWVKIIQKYHKNLERLHHVD